MGTLDTPIPDGNTTLASVPNQLAQETQAMSATKGKKAPGKKECPKCGKLNGPRTKQCECGHVFESSTRQKRQAKGDITAFLGKLALIEAWGEKYKTWEEARDAVTGVLDLAEKVGGEDELLAALKYLEDKEQK